MLTGWGAGEPVRAKLKICRRDFSLAGEVGAIGCELGIDIDDHGNSLAEIDDACGNGIKMLELQRGIEGRVGGVFLRQGSGVAVEIE